MYLFGYFILKVNVSGTLLQIFKFNTELALISLNPATQQQPTHQPTQPTNPLNPNPPGKVYFSASLQPIFTKSET